MLHGLAMVRVRLCNHGAKGVDWPAVRPPAVTCADCNATIASAYPEPAPEPVSWWRRLTGRRPPGVF